MEGLIRLSTCSSGHVSVEFERLSTALYNSRSRILEKSCTDPFAWGQFAPHPGLYCHTGETRIDHEDDKPNRFSCHRKRIHPIRWNNKTEQKEDLFFSDIRFRLIDAEVIVLATSGELCRLMNWTRKLNSGPKVKSASHQQNSLDGTKAKSLFKQSEGCFFLFRLV